MEGRTRHEREGGRTQTPEDGCEDQRNKHLLDLKHYGNWKYMQGKPHSEKGENDTMGQCEAFLGDIKSPIKDGSCDSGIIQVDLAIVLTMTILLLFSAK